METFTANVYFWQDYCRCPCNDSLSAKFNRETKSLSIKNSRQEMNLAG